MSTIRTKDGTEIFFKDWGEGQPIVFHHGWPLSADDWDARMMFFLQHGYRVIAHDRRGHGRLSETAEAMRWTRTPQTWLSLRPPLTYGNRFTSAMPHEERLPAMWPSTAKAVLIGAVPPIMARTESYPGGLPLQVLDEIRAGTAFNRPQFYMDLTLPFFGLNRPGANVSEGELRLFKRLWRRASHTDNGRAVPGRGAGDRSILADQARPR